MPSGPTQENSWRRLVLDSLPKPAWLAASGPLPEFVLSSRFRVMRNLRGHRFTHHAPVDELREIMAKLLASSGAASQGRRLVEQKQLSPTERDYLVACRLVSADFSWNEPGRALLLDETRLISLMLNEEDHLRLQAVVPGWSVPHAVAAGREQLAGLEESLEFARSPSFGYLSASPYNCGEGIRVSAMFHLIGLAHTKRLPRVLSALASRGLASRGLFGEASRALGAFVQISMTRESPDDFRGAGAYLLEEESLARRSVLKEAIVERTEAARRLVQTSSEVSLPDALRVLAWVRWASCERLDGFEFDPKEVDAWFTTLILRTSGDEEKAARARSGFLRERLKV